MLPHRLSFPIFLVVLCLLFRPSGAQAASRNAKHRFGDHDSNEAVVEAESAPAVAGRIRPVLRALASSSDRLHHVWGALTHAPVDSVEFGLLAFVGWGSVPLVDLIEKANAEWNNDEDEESELEHGDAQNGGSGRVASSRVALQESFLYHALEPISEAARTGAFVYTLDFVSIVLNALGMPYFYQAGFSSKAGGISFTVLATIQVSRLKRFLLQKVVMKEKNSSDGVIESARARLLDRALTAVLWGAAGGHVLDLLQVNVGTTVKSLVAFGGMGGLVVSLAMQSFAAQVVSGMVLNSSDRFYVGDKIQLGDGTTGVVTEMSLLHTDLRGPDEIITRLPNDQIVKQRFSNISRSKKSQVKQTLWFPIKDAMKMHDVVAAIKDEIRSACEPDLILDGTRPFRVNWRDIKSDHLEVVVDCHFNLKPSGNAYYDNKQKVLKAIARAVHKLGVEFTLPAQICHTH